MSKSKAQSTIEAKSALQGKVVGLMKDNREIIVMKEKSEIFREGNIHLEKLVSKLRSKQPSLKEKIKRAGGQELEHNSSSVSRMPWIPNLEKAEAGHSQQKQLACKLEKEGKLRLLELKRERRLRQHEKTLTSKLSDDLHSRSI